MKKSSAVLLFFAKPCFRRAFSWVWLCLPLLAGCGGSRNAFTQSGQGSYYADKFAGRATASGVPYRPGQMTAAHNTLPFGTRIRVTNVRNGRSVNVTVNDRGPHVPGRIVDVSRKAARKLDLVDAGVVPVQLRVIRAAPTARTSRR